MDALIEDLTRHALLEVRACLQGWQPVSRLHFVTSLAADRQARASVLVRDWCEGLSSACWSPPEIVHHKAWWPFRTGDGEYELHVQVDSNGRIRHVAIESREQVPDLGVLLEECESKGAVVAARVAVSGDRSPLFVKGDPDVAVPVGSLAKLQLLGAVLSAVRTGRIRWTDTLELTESNRSLPTGDLQEEGAGYKISVLDAAGRALCLSDNTAADLLLSAVGRSFVESRSGVNVPFLSTREMFQLGWGQGSDELVRTWTMAGPAGRRELLPHIPPSLGLEIGQIDGPRFDRGVDWFMSVEEVESELADFHRNVPAEVRDVLVTNANRGCQLDSDTWPVANFKGGAMPGVLGYSWHLVGPSGAASCTVLVHALDTSAVPRPRKLLRACERTLQDIQTN